MTRMVRSLALVGLMVLGLTSLTATPAQDMVWTYFSDATMTTVVGRKFEMCSGTWRTGTTSAYYDIFYGEMCSGGSCIGNSESNDCLTCADGIDNDQDGSIDDYDYGCRF